MKRREALDIPAAEYEAKIIEFRKELMKLQAQAATGTAVKNPGLIKQTKKNIARILTKMNQRKTGSANKA